MFENESELEDYKNRLASCNAKLADMERRCAALESDLRSKSKLVTFYSGHCTHSKLDVVVFCLHAFYSAQASLKTHNLHLESSTAAARSEIAELNKKLAAQAAAASSLRVRKQEEKTCFCRW